jgi:glycosyltransferase involved in cell wall biosynthesis
MRAILLSHAYVSRAARGKLRALNALGCSVAAAVPARWPDPRGLATTVTEWGDDAGVGIVPIGVRGDPAEPETVSWDRRSLRRLLKDFRPDIIQVEEEPWSRAAARTVAEARRLRIPVVGFSWLSLPRAYDLRERLRRRRVLRGIAGTVAGSPQAASLLERARPGLPVTIIPQLGTAAASAAQRVEGPLALGCIGRLVPEKGLDILFRASVKVLGEWTLDVAGTGPAQVELEALAERLGISARIT